ncbi:unnamed protein product [Calicophoron daubneyi]|uniref:Myotubularin phosphatase domain-containing protein n=1 Tax=Calicophoron daubneyi TaxID=300641 RepID=A0AAV2THX6_CALDB
MGKLVYFLPGETVISREPIADGKLIFTDYRLIFLTSRSETPWSIPNAIVWKVENAGINFLKITTKLGSSVMCAFDDVASYERCFERILLRIDKSEGTESPFYYKFRSALKSIAPDHPFLLATTAVLWGITDINSRPGPEFVCHEYKRMKFGRSWKVSEANQHFKICSTYPEYHIIPHDIDESAIVKMAGFRSHKRFPSVVWRSQTTGAVLLRCAQPCVGLMCYRNEHDERFLSSVSRGCIANPGTKPLSGQARLLIVDARTYRVAQLKRLFGGGSECSDYYEQAQVCFMDMPNVHTVRLSFERLAQLYAVETDASWYSGLEKTCWLNYISQLLKNAFDIATALEIVGRPVMVHCTDGWDRTSQLSSLAQLLCDPYYRTIEGFSVLVEREWLQFGHKFADRCGHASDAAYPDERSPIFLQWLDCVHQVCGQFPTYFEFNDSFLVKLGLHVYSGLFGTFLCNSERSRQQMQISSRTCSIWAFLSRRFNWTIVNYLYEPSEERLIEPNWRLPCLNLWNSLYRDALFCSKYSTGAFAVNQLPTTLSPEMLNTLSSALSADKSAEEDCAIPVTSNHCSDGVHDPPSDLPKVVGQEYTSFMNGEPLKTLEGDPSVPQILTCLTHSELQHKPSDSRQNALSSVKKDVPSHNRHNPSQCFRKDDGTLYPGERENDVAILPLSSVSDEISHLGSLTVNEPRLLLCANTGDDGLHRSSFRVRSISSHEEGDFFDQQSLHASPCVRRSSFSTDDCTDVFLADEEIAQSNGCSSKQFTAIQNVSQEDGEEIRSDRGQRSCSQPSRSLEKTSPISICYKSDSTEGLFNRERSADRFVSKLEGVSNTVGTAKDRVLALRNNDEKTRDLGGGQWQGTPSEFVVENLQKNSERVLSDEAVNASSSSDTEKSLDASDYTMHSLPEDELLLINEPSASGQLSCPLADLVLEAELHQSLDILSISEPSTLVPVSNKDLGAWKDLYFRSLVLSGSATEHAKNSVVETNPELSYSPEAAPTNYSPSSSENHATHPVSAPISPTGNDGLESSSYFSTIRSKKDDKQTPSANSHVSSALTLQGTDDDEEDNADPTRIPPFNARPSSVLPDWDGLPSLVDHITINLHSRERYVTSLTNKVMRAQRELAQVTAENQQIKGKLNSLNSPLVNTDDTLPTIDRLTAARPNHDQAPLPMLLNEFSTPSTGNGILRLSQSTDASGYLSKPLMNPEAEAVSELDGFLDITSAVSSNGIALTESKVCSRIPEGALTDFSPDEKIEHSVRFLNQLYRPSSQQILSYYDLSTGKVHFQTNTGESSDGLNCTKGGNSSLPVSVYDSPSKCEPGLNTVTGLPHGQLSIHPCSPVGLLSSVSTTNLPISMLSSSSSSRCRSAGGARPTASSATDGMAQA